MQRTEHFQFAKPDTTDHYNIEDYNEMVDDLDEAMYEAQENATVAARNAFTKIEVGAGLTKSYSDGVLTISLA